MSKENNKLIAEFMGLDSFKDSLASLYQGKINIDIDVYEQAQYHTSWDWLMPVVAKCEHINSRRIREEIGDRNIYGANIDIVHEAVVEFIKWYNEN